MFQQSWLIFAILSALAAAFVPIFGKVGMHEVDSNLATAVRSMVMTMLLAGVCTSMGLWSKLSSIHGRALGMIVLSGLAGAVSWLFYFKAMLGHRQAVIKTYPDQSYQPGAFTAF